MNMKEIRQQTGLNRAQFASYLGIPYRTIQDWEQGKREPARYILDLILYKLENEGMLNSSTGRQESF